MSYIDDDLDGEIVCSNAPPFLQKLYQMLYNEDQSVISFTPDGESLQVHDPRRLEAEVLPRYYDHNSFRSFVRQLNLYAFTKTREPGSWVYSHVHFRRGCPEALDHMRRKVKPRVQQLSSLTVYAASVAPEASSSSAAQQVESEDDEWARRLNERSRPYHIDRFTGENLWELSPPEEEGEEGQGSRGMGEGGEKDGTKVRATGPPAAWGLDEEQDDCGDGGEGPLREFSVDGSVTTAAISIGSLVSSSSSLSIASSHDQGSKAGVKRKAHVMASAQYKSTASCTSAATTTTTFGFSSKGALPVWKANELSVMTPQMLVNSNTISNNTVKRMRTGEPPASHAVDHNTFSKSKGLPVAMMQTNPMRTSTWMGTLRDVFNMRATSNKTGQHQ